jgi:hypothetical protein
VNLHHRLRRPGVLYSRTLEGFRIFCGSRASLMARITRTLPLPSSVSRYCRFPFPIPCSPVQVPSIAMARNASLSAKASTCLFDGESPS